jgi:hypothetical protein
MIAALFAMSSGPYTGLGDVEVWDQKRAARLYAGPWPVVAHPPCERWGRYWHGGPSARVRRVKGDDQGCFAAALSSVRKWGGVLEHPAASSAWDAFGLLKPSRASGWTNADFQGGWTCCVDQGHYGHRAQKATWLYAVRTDLPSLKWGKSEGGVRLDDGFHSAEERRRKIRTGICQRLSHRQRLETPIVFRDLLLNLARSTKPANTYPVSDSASRDPKMKRCRDEIARIRSEPEGLLYLKAMGEADWNAELSILAGESS